MTSSSFSSSSMSPWSYDVFLSFRGEDTRNNFVGHLYDALARKGINTSIDDEELDRGKSISPELMEAIEKSRFAIIIFSKNYASSSWCLDELVKILQCKDTMQQTVFPIFLNVNPSEVRKQTGAFMEAFAKHEQNLEVDTKKVQEWKTALKEVANLSGWDFKNAHEAKLIHQIVREIFTKLNPAPPLNVAKYPVEIDSRVNKVIQLLDNDGSNDVRIVGIYGIGGIGKTTIAKATFNQLFNKFEGSYFLANVRESSKQHGGLAHLQTQLLNEILGGKDLEICNVDVGINVIKNRFCTKKVLVVVDDVDQLDQLQKLVGGHDWFGFGSRIIITTRDEHLLKKHKVDAIYNVDPLSKDEALELFSWHAFAMKHPTPDFGDISCHVINYAGGLPLALEVLGSFLYEKSKEVWEDEVNKLKRIPNRTIMNVLRISYEGLDVTQRDIFLDIACLFKGKMKCDIISLLESCGFYPVTGLNVLIQRSLVTINVDQHNGVWMHDLIQEMGRDIVYQESPKDRGKRSRLWFAEDIYMALTQNTVTDRIEGIMLNMPMTEGLQVSADAFEKMTNLRVLEISKVCLSGCLTFLSNQLVYVNWDGFPLSSFPINIYPKKLVQLHLRDSHIKQMWPSIKILNKLKILNLSGSQYLEKTPDFSGFPCLEELYLMDCTSLVEVHPSIAFHECLVCWRMNGCKNLRRLPKSINMKSLRDLSLTNCSKLVKFPEIEWDMGCLWDLDLGGTAIKDLPQSIEHLNGLCQLILIRCRNLRSIPTTIWKLRSLQQLLLDDCSKLEKIPDIEGDMRCLEYLSLCGTAIKELPSSIERLIGLKELYLYDCKYFKRLPSNIYKMKSLLTLKLRGCIKFEKFPICLREMEGLRLVLSEETCKKQLSSSVIQFGKLERSSLVGCKGFSDLEVSFLGFCSLKELYLDDCNLSDGSILNNIGYLSSLRVLSLRGNNFASMPESINQLTNLKSIILNDCSILQELSLLSSITKVSAHGCISLERLSFSPTRSNTCYRHLTLTKCPKLSLTENLLQKASSIVLTGREIPDWFSKKKEGSSISLQADPLSCSKLKQIAVCAILNLYPEYRRLPFYMDLKVNGYSEKLWVSIFPDYRDNENMLDDIIFFRRTNSKSRPFPPIDDGYCIEASIDSKFNKVKRCGVHLIMVKQVENQGAR